jgi:hypothetical protein
MQPISLLTKTSFDPLGSYQRDYRAWLLPVISLLLTNTVLPVRACQSIWLERFHGSEKEDERGWASFVLFAIVLYNMYCIFNLLINLAISYMYWIYCNPCFTVHLSSTHLQNLCITSNVCKLYRSTFLSNQNMFSFPTHKLTNNIT